MKKYILLIFLFCSFILNGCNKDINHYTPMPIPLPTVQPITIPDTEYEIIDNNIDDNCDGEIRRVDEIVCYKPVIYFYPEEDIKVNIKLYLNGQIDYSYPKYNDGWDLFVKGDGTLIDESKNEYSYVFWEGDTFFNYDLSEGFCIKGEDTSDFLREKLTYMGLNTKEITDFITYWLPHMEKNEYNLISFQGENYTNNAILNINPVPDNLFRVFMVFKPLDEKIDINPQILNKFNREGFHVLEWGGSEIK